MVAMHTAWAKASIAAFTFASAFGSGAFPSDLGQGLDRSGLSGFVRVEVSYSDLLAISG
jgi:hypothetical protein